jgi:mannosyltransferase OCH1-like enzyme
MINKNLYEAMKTWAGKADVLRLEILYQKGGIYTDMDSKMLSPLPILSDLICMTSASGYIANETIYATKGHPAIKEAIEGLQTHLESLMKRQKCNIWQICGATYLTPILSKYKHIKLPHSSIGSRRKRPSIIEHSYDGSWSEGESKATPRELDYWLDTDIIKS